MQHTRTHGMTSSGLLALALITLSEASFGQILHAGDIFPDVQGGRIVVTNGHTLTSTAASQYSVLSGLGGTRFFTGDFGDLPGGAHKTSNPGFDHIDRRLPARALLGLQALGQLRRWDGSTWSIASATVTLEDALGSNLSWTGSGPGAVSHGYIGQIDQNGNLHQHRDILINSGAVSGAYLFTFSLFAQVEPVNIFNPPPPSSENRVPGVADSAPIALMLNRGLSAQAFNAGVNSLLQTPPPLTPTPVPLPGLSLLWGAGLLGLLGSRSGCHQPA